MIDAIKHAALSIMGESGWVLLGGIVVSSAVIIILATLIAKYGANRYGRR